MTFEEWWNECLWEIHRYSPHDATRKAWEAAQRQEREACALIADVVAGNHVYDNGTDESYYAAEYIAEQIRARGKA